MNNDSQNILPKYLPTYLTKKDYTTQKRAIEKTRKLYRKGIFIDRPKLKSFHTRKSNHIQRAKRIYNVDTIKPSMELAKASKCSLRALQEIVKKGRGAYYSSGSRPNQTADSWANARLASALTNGKASIVDYSILKKGCKKTSRVLRNIAKNNHSRKHI
jgi:hypothetical protein